MNVDIHLFDANVKVKDGHAIHFGVITDKNDTEKANSFA